MIVDATYKCKRNHSHTYPMRLEGVRGVMSNLIVYDPQHSDESFSDKCATCQTGRSGVNMTSGNGVTMCDLTLDVIHEQEEQS
jgi:hypothetical protein